MATMTEPTSLASTTMNRQPSRRAVTLPTRIQTSSEQADMDAKGAETLFAHQAAKVVSFSASKLGGPGTSKTSRPEAGTLPWTSRGELLISLGMQPHSNFSTHACPHCLTLHQAPSASTASPAPSPSSMQARSSSPSSPAPPAGASTANPSSQCVSNTSSTASNSPM